jgi:hypothetical protein
VWCSILVENADAKADNLVIFDGLEYFDQNHAVELEAADVAIVSHQLEGLLEEHRAERLIKRIADLAVLLHDAEKGVKGLETEVHLLGLLVLHGKDDHLDHLLEGLGLKVEESGGAMLHNVHGEAEEAFAVLGEGLEVVLDHGESGLAEAFDDGRDLVGEILAHVLDHGGEEAEDFGVAGVRGCLLVVIDQKF